MNPTGYFQVVYDGPASRIQRTSRPPAECDGDGDTYFVFSAAKARLLEHLTGVRDDYADAVRRTRALTLSTLHDKTASSAAADHTLRDRAQEGL